MSFSWKNVIGSVAPTVATALGGPLAGLAVEAVGAALNMPQATVKSIQDTLTQGTMTSDQIVALKQAEIGLKARMRELDIQEESLSYEDAASARNMQIATNDWMPRALALLIVIATLILGAAVVSGAVTKDPTLSVQVGVVIGYAFNELKTVFAYYFGSSRGSDEKSSTIASIAKST